LVRCNSKYKMNKESFTSAESWKFFSKRFKWRECGFLASRFYVLFSGGILSTTAEF
jgi:hypothetical protein